MVIVLVVLVAGMTLVAGQSVIKSSRDSLRAGLSSRARYAARAGLEVVMNELGHDETYTGNQGNRHVGTIPGSPTLSYDVTITNNVSGTQPIAGPNNIQVDPGTVHLQSRGEEQISQTKTAVIGMIGIAFKTQPNFNHGAYASEFLSVEDTEIDAWESANSGWYSQRPAAFVSAPAADREATVGGHAALPTSIRVQGSSKLDGQVIQGPGATSTSTTTSTNPRTSSTTTTVSPVVIDTSATVASTPTISSDPHGTKVPTFRAPFHPSQVGPRQVITPSPPPSSNGNGPPPPPPPPPTLSPGAYQALEVRQDAEVILQSGVYYFQDEFKLNKAKVTLNLNGQGDPVVIFVGKEAQILNKSEINKGGNTDQVQLCFTDEIAEADQATFQADIATLWDSSTATRITAETFGPNPASTFKAKYSKLLVDDSEVTGAIAGSQLEASIQNGSEFFGAIMGKDVRTVNSKMHQDLSLKGARLMTGADWNLGGVHEVKM